MSDSAVISPPSSRHFPSFRPPFTRSSPAFQPPFKTRLTCVTRNPYCHSKSIKYLVCSAFAAQFAANDSANSIVLTSTHPQHENAHASLSVHALSLPHPAPFPFRSLESGAHHPCPHHASRALQHSASLWRAGSANVLISAGFVEYFTDKAPS